MADVQARITAYQARLSALKQQTAALRSNHLHNRLNSAQSRGNQAASKAIIAIIKREANKREWKQVNQVIRPRRSAQVFAISEQSTTPAAPDRYHDTQDGVEGVAREALNARFRLAQ